MSGDIHRTELRETDGGIDWDAAFRRHARWLRTVIASRVGEASAVDDLLQQVGLALSRPERRPSEADHVAPWMYRVAVKQCLMYRRTVGRRRRLGANLEQEPDHPSPADQIDPLDWLLQEERLQAVRSAILVLPDLDRQLLLLKYTEDWSYRQLAAHLGVSVNTVEYRLQLARNRLRGSLQDCGVVEV